MPGGSDRPRLRGFRFPVERRIRKRADYLRIQSGGRRVTTASYVILLAARPDDGPPRLGITATRKLGGAVARNRAKRIVREVFRLHPELFPSGVDLVVIVRGQAHRIGLTQATDEFRAVAHLLARRAADIKASLARGGEALHTPPKPR